MYANIQMFFLLQLHRMLQTFQKSDQTLASIFTNNIPNQPEMPVAQHNPYSSHNEKKSSLAEVKG